MINPAVMDPPSSPAPAAAATSSAQSTRASSPEPRPPLPYLFYHDIDSALTTPPPLINLRSLLRTFTPPLLPPAPYQPHTLASLFAALDQPYGFECILTVNGSRQHTYFIPFLSALFLYSHPSPAHPTPALLFSHTDSLPPHTRYPLPYQVHHLLQHQPVFAGLLNVPLVDWCGERSWLALYWSPVLVDLHHEQVLAGYFLAYYQIECKRRSSGATAAGGGKRVVVAERERERLEAGGSNAAAGGRGGGVAVEEGETDTEVEDDDEPGRREGESDEHDEESKEQEHDVAELTTQLNGTLHPTDDSHSDDDGEGEADDNAAEEGVPQPQPVEAADDARLLLIGYVGCKVDESTWYGEGGQLEGDESAVTDTFTSYRLSSGGGVEGRVTHVDVENELYDALSSDALMHPDYLHAIQSSKTR